MEDQTNSQYKHLIQCNRLFMILCSYLASVNSEFMLPTKRWLKLMDLLSVAWSCLIVVTSSIKFFKYPEKGASSSSSGPFQLPEVEASLVKQQDDSINWTHLLLLNYVPRINQFSSLYHGLVLATVSTALFWRVYINFLRHRHTTGCCKALRRWRRRQQVSQSPFSSTSSSWVSEFNYYHSQSARRSFDGKCELMYFFMFGPPPVSLQKEKKLYRKHQQHHHHQELADALRAACQASHEQQVPTCASPLRVCELLARVHTKGGSVAPGIKRASQDRHGHADQAHNKLAPTTSISRRVQVYRIPNRSSDHLGDKSLRRWRFLALHVHSFTLLGFICGMPLSCLTIAGLGRVHEEFGTTPSIMTMGSYEEFLHIWSRGSLQARVNMCLSIYGFLEQVYACAQIVIFFFFTSIFIKLFHADLIYKVEPILEEIKLLSELYRRQLITTMPMEQIRRQQLRIWSYFDHIRLIDDYLSKYSMVSLLALIVGLSIGQSFARVHDTRLKVATLAAVFGNVLSFTYLHFISEHIERKSYPIQTGILRILACEKNPEAKCEWQRILNGFFQSDWERTFTINGKYPTNLRTFSKTATALLAACTLIHRLFHRNQWNVSFSSSRP